MPITRVRAVFLCICVAVVMGLLGCAGAPSWPQEPIKIIGPADNPASVLWAPAGEKTRYRQDLRDGVKRVLRFDLDGDGQFERLTDLDQLDPKEIQHVFIFLDGVPYKLFAELYDEGHFRLFHRPARFIGPFPTLTDVSFNNIFGVSGMSCYESIIFNRTTNEVHNGTGLYLAGHNELWASRLDYRQALWMDGVSYMLPGWASRREFNRMFARASQTLQDKLDQQNVLIYSISTDALCHMESWQRAREMMIELDRYIEQLMFEREGRLGVIMMTDHGNNFAGECRKAPIDEALDATRLTIIRDRGFRRAGEVLVPRYGLISLVRAYCQNTCDRDAVVGALSHCEGVEQVMWRDGDTVHVIAPAISPGAARICHRAGAEPGREFFSYQIDGGDPLKLGALLAGLKIYRFEGDDADWYDAAELLTATADHDWPDPLWRTWHGLNDQTAVAPDVAASLAVGWYYGAPGLDAFAPLRGTHGGLSKADSVTFFVSTMFAPPPIMRTTDVIPVVNEHFPWTPPTADPATHGLEKYLAVPAAGSSQ